MLHKMPANTGDINDIDLHPVRLPGYLADADAVFFGQLFIDHHLPERCYVIHLNAKHEIFGKAYNIVML